MAYAPGDYVHVAGLGTGVVREVRHGGRHVVEIKGRAVIVGAGDLERADARSARKHSAAVRPRSQARPPRPESTAGRDEPPIAPTLDLHGRTVAESIDSLAEFIDAALRANHREVRVIHGRSGGRIKAAVSVYLAQLRTVASFRLDPHNPGVTVVIFA